MAQWFGQEEASISTDSGEALRALLLSALRIVQKHHGTPSLGNATGMVSRT